MKKYFSFLLIVTFLLSTAYYSQAQKQNEGVLSTIELFPFQQMANAGDAVKVMNTWKKKDWKKAIKYLDDDSLKVKASLRNVPTASQFCCSASTSISTGLVLSFPKKY